MKKIFLISFIFLTVLFSPINICASDLGNARIGNNFFDNLEDAINAASSTDIINLTSDVTLQATLDINKTVNINLNNHEIKADEKVFLIQGGSLNLSGSGKIIETKPNYGTIVLLGSDNPTKQDYSTVSVGSDILLEGWSGIFINHLNKTGYGIRVNMNGSINAVEDISGNPGAGIYVNGNIQNENNSPIVNLSETTKISSSGTGIYAAGYATYNINGAYISGKNSGLGIKSGVFNILNGTIIGSGEDKTPTSGNNNGINPSGAAIQVESNPGYVGNIEINIENGLINSKNSNVIYEYTVNNFSTEVKNFNISGGKFISDARKQVFKLSDSFMNNHQGFISGGAYSSDPSKLVKSGYSVSQNENSLYEVIRGTMGVFGTNQQNSKVHFSWIIVVCIFVILGFIIYLNRNKIFNLINSIRKK